LKEKILGKRKKQHQFFRSLLSEKTELQILVITGQDHNSDCEYSC